MLLNQAAAMVDGVYQDIFEALKPGRARERDRGAGEQAALRHRLRSSRGDQRDQRRALQPAPPQFLRPLDPPGDQAFFDIIHSYNGYRTCYYRTFASAAPREPPRRLRRAREWMDAAIHAIRPGVGTDEVAAVWPAATILDSTTRWRPSDCNSAMASGWVCTSARSSPG